MNLVKFKKSIRRVSVRLGIFRPLPSLVFRLRGSKHLEKEIAFHRRFLTENQLVFDVGANRGQSSEIFLAVGARVVAFEPQADMHGEIMQVCRHSPKLTVEPIGLGKTPETKILYTTEYDQAASLRQDWEGKRIGEASIEISTLDIQIARHGLPDYCKIDVEGWELPVIEGLSKPIPMISFEYHASPGELTNACAVLAKLTELGQYHCNLKSASQRDFHLSSFVPITEFGEKFTSIVTEETKDGYGDIFCTLNTGMIQD